MNKFDKKCSKCKNYNGNILICESCAHYIPKQTVFAKITASIEVLANELVTLDCDGWWAYVGIGKRKTYPTREEAVAATVEGLKEVYNDQPS